MKYLYRTIVFMTVVGLAIWAALIAAAIYLIKIVIRKGQHNAR